MTGRNGMGVSRGRGIAGIIAAAVLLTLGAQGAVGAPSDRKPDEKRKGGATRSDAATKSPAPTTQKSGMVTRPVGGVQVTIDPATGRVQQPTPEQAEAMASALQRMLSRETEGRDATPMPDGGVMVSLDDTFQEVAMATVDLRGRVRLHCVNDAERAMAILKGTVTPDGPVYTKGRAAEKKSAAKSFRDAVEKE